VSYESQAAAIDRALLEAIGTWHRNGLEWNEAQFAELARSVFAHQLQYNQPYARYCATFGVTIDSMPETYAGIPAVPTAAYKEATLTTFDPARATLAFETSGTTQGAGGRHYMETSTVYDASLLAAFDRFMLADGARLRYFNFVPNPADRPQSSLGYMMARVSERRGDGKTGWFVRGDELFVDAFVAAADAAIRNDVPVCIAGTAFAFVQLCDQLAARNRSFTFPAGSRIMETGGFKGRSRILAREDLYAALAIALGIPQHDIIAEYSMTELSSQWYDDAATRVKRSPPWLRALVVGANNEPVPDGIVGSIVHVDLANRSSCLAVLTEDLGAIVDGGLVLLGRERGAALRGCSLDAETLRTR